MSERMSDRKQKPANRLNINDSIHGKGFKHTQEEKAEMAENSKYLALKIYS